MKQKPKDIFTTLARRLQRTPAKIKNTQLMHPAREWLIGLGLALSICVFGAAWSAYTYLYYERVTFDAPETVRPDTSVYREAVVAAALDTYTERRVSYDQFLVEGPRQLDRTDDTSTTTAPTVEMSPAAPSPTSATTTATTTVPTAPQPFNPGPTSTDFSEPTTLVP